MTYNLGRRACVAIVSLLACALAGCSSPQPATGPYAADIELARTKASSDFERDVLADSTITRAEYEEAVQRFVKCVNSSGAKVATEDQDGYYIYRIEGDVDAYDGVRDQCQNGTNGLIEALYVDQLTNPDKRTLADLLAACFRKHGIAPPNFTTEDMQPLLKSQQDLTAANDPGGDWEGYDFDPATNPKSSECFSNPNS